MAQVQRDRSERELCLHLHDEVAVVVGQPDFGVAIFGEDPFRFDRWADDDRLEAPCWNGHALATNDFERDGIAVRLEVAIEFVALADLEWDGAQEKEERAFIERLVDAGLLD